MGTLAGISWIDVGDPGNPADATGFGAVVDNYEISEFEITNSQYTRFLNSVGGVDSNQLYNVSMDVNSDGGIERSAATPYTYTTKSGFDEKPVNYVSFWDALRFVNWLHNGEPVGLQNAGTTEDGAYTLTPAAITANSVMRNPSGQVFVPSEDEWYKAAYHEAGTASYFDYPAASDSQTLCTPPGGLANRANCSLSTGGVTAVGAYTGASSPHGTFDQGGNVAEWNETIISSSRRGTRGGGFPHNATRLGSSWQDDDPPGNEFAFLGFRVVRPVPEPAGGLGSGLLLLAMLYRRKSSPVASSRQSPSWDPLRGEPAIHWRSHDTPLRRLAFSSHL